MYLTRIVGLSWFFGAVPFGLARSDRPNVVFILTDDQDTHMTGLEHMPLTQRYLVDHGTTFNRHYCTGSLCRYRKYPDVLGR